MADPFQPRFVDLVRNYTSTAGTGNLVLGDAAPGFTGFASALQPGDRFYYSVAGLEKTDESEVGRGTLQADGTISREPISSVPTSFSPGRKTIALVAAAEWYEAVDGARAALQSAPTRTALAELPAGGAALLAEAGREGLFTFDPADRSASVSADPAQGIFVAPASDPTGASGAWVRKIEGKVSPEWFGILEGDSAGANAAANDSGWAALTSCLRALAANPDPASNTQGLHQVGFGLGTFEFSATFDLKDGTLEISGRGSGHGRPTKSSGSTKLKFYGCSGIRIQARDTSGESAIDAVAHLSAIRTVIRDLDLEGDFSGTEAEHHGIHARAAVTVENVNIRNFAGDGRRVEADTNTTGGNANSCEFIGGQVWNCRNGHRTVGNNCNACVIIGGRYAQNRQWGIWESCTIGNYYYGIHTTANGVINENDGISIGASVVSHGGNRYFAIVGEEGWASANAPSGTTADNQGWAYLSAGDPEGGRPAWFSGMLVRPGGAIFDDQDSAPNYYTGYTEQNQGKTQIYQRSIVTGGNIADWCYQSSAATKGTSIIRSTVDAVVELHPAAQVVSGNVTVKVGASRGNGNQIGLGIYEPTYAPSGHELFIAPNGTNTAGDLLLSYNHSTSVSTYALQLTGPSTPLAFGRSATQPNSLYLPRLFVGPSGPIARQISIDSGPPSSGERGQGDWVLARDGDSNRIGWKGTAAGSPGTFNEIFGLSQLSAAGSGLTVSATDRLLGRVSSGSGAVQEIACTAAGRALLDDIDPAAQRVTLGLRRGLAFHCAGLPAGNEVIGGGLAPYAMTLSAAGSTCKALAAATGATALVVKNNGTAIGQIDFVAGATAGSVTITTPSIAAGDHITIHNAAAADSTLADIDGLLAE